MRKVILASKSKARKKLLKQIGLKFTVTQSNAKEHKSLKRGCGRLVIDNALNKAKEVAKRAIDLSSDYIVPELLGGYFSPLKILGVPTKAGLGLIYNGFNTVAHVALAAKKTLDGDTTERNNHIKSAGKIGRAHV